MESTTGTADFSKDWQVLVFLIIAIPAYFGCNFRRRRRRIEEEPAWRQLQFLRTASRNVDNFTAPREERVPPPNPPAAVSSGYSRQKITVQGVVRRAQDIFSFHYIIISFFVSVLCSYLVRIAPEIGKEMRYVFFSEPSVFAYMGAIWKTLETVLFLGSFPFGLYMYHCMERFRNLAVLMHVHRQQLCSVALLLGEALPECIPPTDDDEMRRDAGQALAEEILQAKWTLYRFLNVAHYCSYATMSSRFRQIGFTKQLVRTGLLLEQEAKFMEVYASQPRNIADTAYRWICQMIIALVRAEATELQAIQGILQALTGLRDAYARLAEFTAYRQPAYFQGLMSFTVKVVMVLTPPSLAYAFSTAHTGISTYLVPAMGSMLITALFRGSLDVVQALQTPFESRLYDLDPDWMLMSTERALFEILACDVSELFRAGSGVVPVPVAVPQMVEEEPEDAAEGKDASVAADAEESEDGGELVEVPSLILPRQESPGSEKGSPRMSVTSANSQGGSPRSPALGRMRRSSGDGAMLGLPENLRRFSLEVGSAIEEPVIEEDEFDLDGTETESSISSHRSKSSHASRASRASRRPSEDGTTSMASAVPEDLPFSPVRSEFAGLAGLQTDSKYKGPFFGPGVEPDDVDGLLKVLHDWAAPTGNVALSQETLERLTDIMQRHFAKIEQLLAVYNFLPDDDMEHEKGSSWGDHEHLVADLLMRLHEASRASIATRKALALAGAGDPGRIAFEALFPGVTPPERPPLTLEQRRREMVAKAHAEARDNSAKKRAEDVARAIQQNVAARQEQLRARRQAEGGAAAAAAAVAAMSAASPFAPVPEGDGDEPRPTATGLAELPEDSEAHVGFALVPAPVPVPEEEPSRAEDMSFSQRLGRQRRLRAGSAIPEVK
mmetsp:Transcript_38040/g.88983  ORF Transcript_38040/g.88983 Transcript_38040/m.88983 type:complete len:896 (+) Transcript_38040:131-2818(+)|eukprot:CAMPEP_0178383820 /NCGR_PEP_ID=MMETSP0689_2-20121128/7197_1 /TAXON_ID=160604 /ORGANISM="Amphidinium massartii, Strain CS-259" /LENGTH=895 /DNA_ID=CAMNT_0020004049 /DNA_START=124 /DNA_END=2811 /DNA_ORIENTATION=+